MKLKKQTDNTLLIDNSHESFKDTPYENEPFTVTIRLDTTSEMSSITDAIIDETKRTGEQPSVSIPFALITKWKLLSPIIAWTGFNDVDDKELPCSLENKSLFYEMSDYVDLFVIIKSIKDEYISKRDERNKEVEEHTKKS